MVTLVIDVGIDIVGVFSVEDKKYVAYRGDAVNAAVRRIQDADEVVTFCGFDFHDLEQLGKRAGAHGDLPLKGAHSDMSRIRWDGIVGKSLRNTFFEYFEECPDIPFAGHEPAEVDKYEADNRQDVYMTLKLWELWKQRKLTNLAGEAIV
jgi:hypothetical protein